MEYWEINTNKHVTQIELYIIKGAVWSQANLGSLLLIIRNCSTTCPSCSTIDVRRKVRIVWISEFSVYVSFKATGVWMRPSICGTWSLPELERFAPARLADPKVKEFYANLQNSCRPQYPRALLDDDEGSWQNSYAFYSNLYTFLFSIFALLR